MERILARLMDGDVVSGQALSEELSVTRAAVWKQIEQLRQSGFVIESLGRQGYRLLSCPDSLLPPVIAHGLQTAWAGRAIVYQRQVDSTNRLARRLAAEGAAHGTLVIAEEQTAGRGRRGRGWLSPPGESIYMTLILRPQAHPSQVALLSLHTALAVARGIGRACGVDARIKWPNDIVVGGRKVCGMLLEMDADEQSVYDVAAGIGINVHPGAVSPEIAATAGALDALAGRALRRADIVRAFLEEFEAVEALAGAPDALMAAYVARSATIGQTVRVVGYDEEFCGTALRVTPGGALVVRMADGAEREVLAGDVSVRGVMGYV